MKKIKLLALLFISTILFVNCSSDDAMQELIVEAPITATFIITNSGTTAYIFNGGTFSNTNNPELTLKRGQTYEFAVNASGHPFFIKSVQGNTNANAYSNGVSNNGTEQGTLTFTVPANAPNTLFYNCQNHSVMTAKINIID